MERAVKLAAEAGTRRAKMRLAEQDLEKALANLPKTNKNITVRYFLESAIKTLDTSKEEKADWDLTRRN